MTELIAGEITDFFASGFVHTAWRWETRREYGVPSETADFRRFLRGEPASPDTAAGPWRETMRLLHGQGKSVARVRVLDEPPTGYQRWLLEDVLDSVEAGEDIRYLSRSAAEELDLPMDDFWLFDSHTVGVFHYDGNTSLGMELRATADEAAAACRIRDAVWPHACLAEAVVRQAHPTT